MEAGIGRLLSVDETSIWPGGKLRSAFSIGNGFVVTAWHCLKDLGEQSARPWLRLSAPRLDARFIDVPLKYHEHVAEFDAAVLALDDERREVNSGSSFGAELAFTLKYLDSVAIPLGAKVSVHDTIRIGGFPESDPLGRHPVMISGNVESVTGPFQSHEVIRLHLRAAAARFPDKLSGVSGGPLLCFDRDGVEKAVGVFYGYPPTDSGREAVGGTGICHRLADIAEHLGPVAVAISSSRVDTLPRFSSSGRIVPAPNESSVRERRTIAAASEPRSSLFAQPESFQRDIIVVIPGIGGSVLSRPSDGRVVWGTVGSVPEVLKASGQLALETNPHLQPVGLVAAKSAIPGFVILQGYDSLWSRLRRLQETVEDPGDPGTRDRTANLVAFPYDFRKGIAETAAALESELAWRLADSGISTSNRHPRVLIVAHGEGGLVARYWLSVLGGWRQCRGLITLGTPNRGTPKALDLLINGTRLGGRRLRQPSELQRTWASVYDILPRYRCIWDSQRQEAIYPHELPSLGFNFGTRARLSYALHLAMEDAWNDIPIPSLPVVRSIVGVGQRTESSATWDGERLFIASEPPKWLAGVTREGGDGSVPEISAIPIEDALGTTVQRVNARHGMLPSHYDVVSAIEQIVSAKPLTPVR